MVKSKTKAVVCIFLVDMLSNLLLLTLYKIPLSQEVFIGSIVFTLVLTLVLNQCGVLDDKAQ